MTPSTTSTASSGSAFRVRVGVRVRPEPGVVVGSASSALAVTAGRSIELSQGRQCHRYTYDAVFGASTSQSTLYEQVSPPLLRSFLNGYNATVRGEDRIFATAAVTTTDTATSSRLSFFFFLYIY